MKNKKNTKDNKGITLVALIITIVILMILAVVAIGAINKNNLINHAQNGSTSYVDSKSEENTMIEGYVNQIELKVPNKENTEGTEDAAKKEMISTTHSYVGYYADVDANGSVDGIIYADLAIGGSGKWIDENGNYKIDVKENLNNYYIIKEEYEVNGFGKNAVVAPIDKVEKNDRFYVMALEDINPGTVYHWYYSAYTYEGKMNEYTTDTSSAFGKGKDNTTNMISFWKNSKYGAGDKGTAKDVWGQIEVKVSEGWFVPSKEEWGAFGALAAQKGMKVSNYTNYNLSNYYWSSSQLDKEFVWYVNFADGYMGDGTPNGTISVRLSTTF